jgi:NitT/TauT family transport system substrate-binding protein
MDSLAISATANGLNYLPEYYADATGLFADAGLAVTATARDPWTGVLEDLDSGAADIALGGLWVPGMYAGSARHLTVVGQLNHRFPMGILSRDGSVTGLADLPGRVVLAPGAGGSAPYLFTVGLLRESGVDPAGVKFVRDLNTAMLLELFAAGLGDAIVADLVTLNELQAAGAGRIVFSHLDSGGTMPNSVYYCRTDRVEELRPRLTRFVGAMAAAMEQLPGAAPATIDAILAARWPDKDQDLLRAATAELVASGVWATVAIDPAASDRWMRMLAEDQVVVSAPGYPTLADDSFMKSYR